MIENNELYVLKQGLINSIQKASSLLRREFDVTQKRGFENIVTSNDMEVQNFLKYELSKLLPESGFLCEEESAHSLKHYTWIIDPIDGTTNYSRGIDDCAISVALKENDLLLVGAVYLPFKDEMFSAIRGQGAYVNNKKIHVSQRSFENSLLCTSLCAYHKENLIICSSIINETFLQCNDIRRFGSAASELCYIAQGQCELFFEYEIYPWDYAAASLILNEAGGCISDIKGDNPLFENKTCIIAANSQINLERLKKIITKYI